MKLHMMSVSWSCPEHGPTDGYLVDAPMPWAPGRGWWGRGLTVNIALASLGMAWMSPN